MQKLLVSMLAALTLSACGGGDEADPPDGQTQCIGGVLYDSTGTPAATTDPVTGVTRITSC